MTNFIGWKKWSRIVDATFLYFRGSPQLVSCQDHHHSSAMKFDHLGPGSHNPNPRNRGGTTITMVMNHVSVDPSWDDQITSPWFEVVPFGQDGAPSASPLENEEEVNLATAATTVRALGCGCIESTSRSCGFSACVEWWKFSGFQGFKKNGTCLAMLKLYEKLVWGKTGMWPFFASELL